MYIDIKNQNIFYQTIGRGPNLVLLHGWGNDSSSFWGVVDTLKNDFTLWLIDLPGFGRSENPKKPFTVSDYSEIVKGFIEKLNIKNPTVLGHSVGGRIAIKLASKYPKLIDKLILEASAGIKPRRGLFKPAFYFLSKIANGVFPDIFSIKQKFRTSLYRYIGSDYLTNIELRETFKKIIAEDLNEDISKIKQETLLLWGEVDPTEESSINSGKKMYRLIQNSKLVIFEEVGHFPHLERPERFVKLIKDFAK